LVAGIYRTSITVIASRGVATEGLTILHITLIGRARVIVGARVYKKAADIQSATVNRTWVAVVTRRITWDKDAPIERATDVDGTWDIVIAHEFSVQATILHGTGIDSTLASIIAIYRQPQTPTIAAHIISRTRIAIVTRVTYRIVNAPLPGGTGILCARISIFANHNLPGLTPPIAADIVHGADIPILARGCGW